MYDIKKDLQTKRIIALKAKDKERATFLSTMLSEVKTFEINSRVGGVDKEISEEDAIKVFNKMIKSRKESIEFFEKNGRLDLLEKEIYQVGLISEFVPVKLTEEEIDIQVKQVLSETDDKTMKNLMPILKSKFGQNADMKMVRQSVEKLLS